jgi:ABC-type bacteriocin/lantibiotic exporter with double-glycine peptidase domain
MSKVPVSLQSAQTECGLCVARSVLAAHGHDVAVTDLRAVIEPGRDGLSLGQIGQLLRSRGMATSIYRVRDNAGLDVLPTPFVAHWKGYHFVVVEKVTNRSAVIMDPMVGHIRVPRSTLDEEFAGLALVAEPGEDFHRCRRPLFSAWRGKPIWPERARWFYLATALLSLVVFGLTLAIPLLTEYLVDRAGERGFRLLDALLAVAAAAAAYAAVQIVRTYVTTALVRKVSWQLLNSAFGHLIRLPLKYFMSRAPGELMYRLNSMNQVRDIIATQLVQGLLDTLTAAVLVGYVFSVAVSLGFATLGIFACVLALLVLSRRLIKSTTDSEVHHVGRTQSIQMDAVVSMTQVRVGGYAGTYLDDWRSAYRQALAAMTRRMRIQQGWIGATIGGIQAYAPLAILVTSIFWARSGIVTLGEAVAVQGVSALLFGLTTSIGQTWTQSLVASRYLERAEDIYAYPTERSGGRHSRLEHTGISLDDVSFRYTDHSADVIRSVNIEILPGSVVAIVGESGSGKTTLGKILCSLYSPTRGVLRFGGTPVEDFDLDALRGHIGYIPQEGYLHNRTLAANLTLGTGAEEADAIAACRQMPFMGFVDEMPMGYHTVVSEMGANFSGGQRQRIAVAKALIRRPDILVLDEATSALDNANQQLVHDHIKQLRCTQIIIAHRLSTVVDADQILVLEGGHVVDIGTHTELSARSDAYARMYGKTEVMVHG